LPTCGSRAASRAFRTAAHSFPLGFKVDLLAQEIQVAGRDFSEFADWQEYLVVRRSIGQEWKFSISRNVFLNNAFAHSLASAATRASALIEFQTCSVIDSFHSPTC
jgi:hypothetical protein